MAQNIYDDEAFFAAYAAMRRSTLGLDGAPEWPALRALLPAVAGRRVLDLGCGYGWFCRWAADSGAAHVVGVDLSERMLTRAGQLGSDPVVEYRRADLDDVELGSDEYEVVYSSLALHYVASLDRLVAQVARALTAGGSFVFSVEHPIFTAPSTPGFVARPDGHMAWPVDGYLAEGRRVTNWLVPGVVKHHRTMATHLGALRSAGLAVREVVEWAPSPAQVAQFPEWAPELERPAFLLIAADRT